MNADPNTAKSLFLEAVDRHPPDQWPAFLDRTCAGQPELRGQVEALLKAHQEVGTGQHHEFAEGADRSPVATNDLAPVTETPGTAIGPYKLIEPIGEGGMGTVWMAQQTEPVKRLVALKLIKAGMDTKQVIARFEAERQALALMDHPNIAKVLDAGVSPPVATGGLGRPYFVMDLVRGLPITQYCDEHHLTPRQRLELFIPVCQAVQHAHQKGVIHRDIKPSNVLVALYDSKPVPKVIDFGVAKAAGQPLTKQTLVTGFGAIVGTLEYMSPEQAEINQIDIDTRCDIYSLGVLLYELLTGSPPFSRKELEKAGMLEMLRVIREQEPSKPSTKLSTADGLPTLAANRGTEPAKLTKLVRGELDWIVMKALEKDRNRRYETANGFAMDVQRYLADEAVEAGPPRATYRLKKFVRRNKGPVLASFLILLLLIAGIVGTTIGLLRALESEGLAERRRVIAVDSEAAEKKQRQAAEANLKEARAIEDFLTNDLLGYADVGMQEARYGSRNPKITVRELLDLSATTIESKFRDQPLVEAAIRSTIGKAYIAVGEFEKARIHLQRSHDLRQTNLGKDDRVTWQSRHELGIAHFHLGRYEIAELYYRDVLEKHSARFGPDHPDSLSIQSCLIELYRTQGRYDEAEPLILQLLQRRIEVLGPDHPETLGTMNNLGVLYDDKGEYDRAEPIYARVLQAHVARLGLDHPVTLTSKNNLALVYRFQGKYDLAEPLFKEALLGRAAILGPNHPATLQSKHNLGAMYLHLRLFEQAKPLLVEVLNARLSRDGAENLETLSSKNSVAELYREQGELVQAERLHLEVFQVRAAKLGPDHPNTLFSKSNLALVYHGQRKYDQAERLGVEVVKARTAKLGADHPDTLTSKSNLALVYGDQKKYQQAEALCVEVLGARTAKLGAEHPSTLRSKNILAISQMDQGKHEQAEPLLREVVEAMSRKLGMTHPSTRPYVGNLIACYEEMGQPARGEPLRRELAETSRRIAGPQSPEHALDLFNLANNLLKQDKYVEAESSLRECLAVESSRNSKTWTVFNVQSVLGFSLLGQKRYAEAEPLLVEGVEGMIQQLSQVPPSAKPRVIQALKHLVQLYQAWGKKDEESKWRKKLDEFSKG